MNEPQENSLHLSKKKPSRIKIAASPPQPEALGKVIKKSDLQTPTAITKMMMDSLYLELLEEPGTDDMKQNDLLTLNAAPSSTQQNVLPETLPFVCNFCKKASFLAMDECYNHAQKCVFNPREDPFVKHGITEYLQGLKSASGKDK